MVNEQNEKENQQKKITVTIVSKNVSRNKLN
jgi:hypothetical protein